VADYRGGGEDSDGARAGITHDFYRFQTTRARGASFTLSAAAHEVVFARLRLNYRNYFKKKENLPICDEVHRHCNSTCHSHLVSNAECELYCSSSSRLLPGPLLLLLPLRITRLKQVSVASRPRRLNLSLFHERDGCVSSSMFPSSSGIGNGFVFCSCRQAEYGGRPLN